ncbi:hypothetical protein F5Y10DRAFT_285937 [Nemania abortiva]|nr:hypothetical protein F5Y10DRAFT_285937 [Nemania abortiva]
MVNIVDDLNLSQSNNLVLYFFYRRDNPSTLRVRGIFGSLIKQVLQSHINSDTMDDIFEDLLPDLGFNKLMKVLATVMQRQNKTHQVHILLDGFEECDEEEIELVKSGLIETRSFCKIIVSVRSQVNDPTTPRLDWDYSEMSVPDGNPDIEEFIDSELIRRIQSKTLSLGSPELVIDIKDALLRGARGMCLWVVLQIECICTEQTDDSIRKALLNLPKDLFSTFRHILQKSKQHGIPLQRNILKLLVGANRPLVANELREALSVTPYELSRTPDKMINNIYNTLKCCGSLVLIDEEERTFLIEANEETHDWAFTVREADHYIGEVTVTYLNYPSFEQRLSTKIASSVPAGDTPSKIMEPALQPYGLVGRLALAYLQPSTQTKQDIGKVLCEASSKYRRKCAASILSALFALATFCSVMPYLTSLQSANSNPKFSPEMGALLLCIATMFRAGLVTNWLLRIRRYTMDDYCRIIGKAGLAECSTVRWMICRPSMAHL